MKVCPKCGCGEFAAHQVCYCDVVVDGDNKFLENGTGTIDDRPDIYEADDPYGPYTCRHCGKEFDNLGKELIDRDAFRGRRIRFVRTHSNADAYRYLEGKVGVVTSINDSREINVMMSNGCYYTIDPREDEYEIYAAEKTIAASLDIKNIIPSQLDVLTKFMESNGIGYSVLPREKGNV